MIQLTEGSWQKEIEKLKAANRLSDTAATILIAVLTAYVHHVNWPMIFPNEIQEARKYLGEGVIIRWEEGGSVAYDVMVAVSEDPQFYRPCFVLAAQCNGCKLEYLNKALPNRRSFTADANQRPPIHFNLIIFRKTVLCDN